MTKIPLKVNALELEIQALLGEALARHSGDPVTAKYLAKLHDKILRDIQTFYRFAK